MYKLMHLFCLFWLMAFMAHALAASLQDTTAPIEPTTTVAAPQLHQLQAREQSAGSSCSDEGQWNCMTNSWQRCAAGRWSVTMQCAKGTTCSPSGLTHDFQVHHDGSVNGNGESSTTSVAKSLATRNWASRMGIWGLLFVFWIR